MMAGQRWGWIGLATSGLIASSENSAAEIPPSAGNTGVVVVRQPSGSAVYLRSLTFDMGSSEEELLAALVRCKREPLPDRCDELTFRNETPLHRQQVASFWMARTEVSVLEYTRCASIGRCPTPSLGAGALRFQQPALPMTFVTFHEAAQYCAFRGGRLPSEAEFERAARGAGRRIFPWGHSYHSKLSNHGRLGVDGSDASDGYGELAPVGSFPNGATPEGVLDLAGNAAEWTATPFAPEYGAPATTDRVVRGGSYGSAPPFIRGAARAHKPPETREPTLGFRCVWAAKPPGD